MIGIILTVLKLLATFIPNAQQRQDAQQAIQDNYLKFIQSTDGVMYSAVRSLEILGALWDVFFNHGRAWAEASASLSATPFGAVELIVLLWPFFGNTLSAIATQALQLGLKMAASGQLSLPASTVKPAPKPFVSESAKAPVKTIPDPADSSPIDVGSENQNR